MIKTLSNGDIERILLIHHIAVIGLMVALVILWVKFGAIKRELNRIKSGKF